MTINNQLYHIALLVETDGLISKSNSFDWDINAQYKLFSRQLPPQSMGNEQSHSWEQQYEPIEELSAHRLRVRRKTDHSQNFQLCSFFIPAEQESAFLARIRQRQLDRNIYIQRLIHYGKIDSNGLCGNGERFTLLFRETTPTIADHCRARTNRKQHFLSQEICYVIRSVCLGLAYLKSIGQSHGNVHMDTISTNQQIFLIDPICQELQQQSSNFQKRRGRGFPSPQKLREQYDFLVNLDEHSSDLFSLGATALQMHHLSLNINDIYSAKNASYRNTFINYEMVSQLIAAISDNRLREWVWTLMNPDERARGKIYELIQNYQVDVKKLKILKENPLKLKPEQELVQPIDPYVDSQPMNKNSLVRQQKIQNFANVQNVNILPSNRPSIMMPMPITHIKNERILIRPTLTKNVSSDSLIKFNHPINTQHSRPIINYANASETPHLIHTRNVSNHIQFPQSIPKQFDISFKPSLTMSSYGQVYKNSQTKQKQAKDASLSELNDSLKRLSQNLKSFIDQQSKQLSWKRQNMVLYDVDTSKRPRPPPIITQPIRQPQILPQIRKLQFRKASSLYTELVPIIPEVQQQQHSNITESEYVIEQYQIGTKYQGFKRNGKRNGTGKFYYSEGSCYEGDWKDNKMHGFGVLTYPNGAYAYQGQWKNDQFHGKGTLYNNDPTPVAGMLNPQDLTDVEDVWMMYEGEMANGHRSGWGKLTFINGQHFEGEFKNDEISGNGLFFSLNGTKIQGRWQEGKLVHREN